MSCRNGDPRTDTNPKSDIGIWIVRNRLKHNLTQDRLADIIGCSRQTLVNWEQGHTEVSKVARYGLWFVFQNIENLEDMDAELLNDIYEVY